MKFKNGQRMVGMCFIAVAVVAVQLNLVAAESAHNQKGTSILPQAALAAHYFGNDAALV